MALSINKKKLGKLFALQLSLGIVLGQGVFAQSVDSVNETALNEKIIVEAQKMSEKESADKVPGDFIQHKGTIGILGEKDVMDVPFQQMNRTYLSISIIRAINLQPIYLWDIGIHIQMICSVILIFLMPILPVYQVRLKESIITPSMEKSLALGHHFSL